jgi:hypothetical protein
MEDEENKKYWSWLMISESCGGVEKLSSNLIASLLCKGGKESICCQW